MAAINKVTYKIKNLSDAPISFVGLHTLSIPGASEAEYTLSEAAWKKLLPRLRAKKTLVVTKVSGASSDTATTATATTKATASTTSTKTSATKSTKSSTASTTKETTTASTSTSTTSDSTTSSTDAATSTTEG